MQADDMSDVESLLKQLVSKDSVAISLSPASDKECAKKALFNCLDQVMKIEGFQFCVNFLSLSRINRGLQVTVDDLVTLSTLKKTIEDGHITTVE